MPSTCPRSHRRSPSGCRHSRRRLDRYRRLRTRPGTRDARQRRGAGNVADACRASGATMVHISTNEVFDGEKGEPYAEDDCAATR